MSVKAARPDAVVGRDARGHSLEDSPMKRLEQSKTAAPDDRELDMLAVAIVRMGGIKGAAQVMGVSRKTIYNWLNNGLGGVKESDISSLIPYVDCAETADASLKPILDPLVGRA